MKYSGGFEDDTVASTVSYLSSVALRSLGSVDVPVEAGRVIEIPFREQDDPPDFDGDSAASLDSGIEHDSTG